VKKSGSVYRLHATLPVFRKEVYLEIKLDETEGDQREAVAKALEELKGS